MRTEGKPIARIELVRVRASGERVSIVVEIGQPFHSSEGPWRTPVAFHGLDGRLIDICGEDSLQSLSLALSLLHHRLASIVESGDKLINMDGDEFPFDAYFTKA